jgi:hypothetical protein
MVVLVMLEFPDGTLVELPVALPVGPTAALFVDEYDKCNEHITNQ